MAAQVKRIGVQNQIERRKDTFSDLVYSDTIGLKRLWARDYDRLKVCSFCCGTQEKRTAEEARPPI